MSIKNQIAYLKPAFLNEIVFIELQLTHFNENQLTVETHTHVKRKQNLTKSHYSE